MKKIIRWFRELFAAEPYVDKPRSDRYMDVALMLLRNR